MDPKYWGEKLRDAEHLEDLLERLGDVHGPPVAFVVGSALSLPAADGLTGVPGVEGCVAIARELVSQSRPKALTRFDEAIKGKEGSERYAAAFEFLQRTGPDQANEVVRQATLRARSPDARPQKTDSHTEADLDGWALSRGTRALGELLVKFRERYPGPLLTTNFDPLVSVAVERAGGQPNPIVFVKDRDPPSRAEHRAHETQIIHLHGYWRDSDTMHTMDQLGARRERLERWCEEVLRGRLLLVVGYAGWDDVFTRMIGSLADPHGTGLQVAWAFFSKRPSEIMGSYARLLDRFEQWRSTGRLRIYVGIDAHVLFERLLEQARGEKDAEAPVATAATAATATAVPATVVPATVVPSDKARTRRHLRVVGSLSTDADRHAPHEDGAARATEPEPKAWKQLSLHQKDWLRNIVAQLTRLLDGGPGPWSYSARPELPRAAMLRSRLPEVCDVLNDLGSIRPDDWPDIAWVLQLDEARAEAEAAVDDLNVLPETLSPSLQDPPSRAWNTGVDTLEKALTGILADIRRRYPRAEPRR